MRFMLMAVVALWLGGCASAVTSGYGQGGRDPYGRSYEEARADNLISAAVTSALVRDPKVPAIDINVKTLNGVVTLTGSVPSRTIAARAEHLAADVEKVERVDNRLRVSR